MENKNLIEIRNLKKIYRTTIKKPGLTGAVSNLFHSEWQEKVALNNISFCIHEGQTLACIGENGAGKSTLIKLMIGILTPTEGEVSVSGKNPRKAGKDYLRNIGVVFGQKSSLWTDIPVIESYNCIQTMYKLSSAEYKTNLNMIVELLDLSPVLSFPARRLSLGQRMKADIGMALLHSPKLLFLDEPTIGLDIHVKHAIRSFLRQMNKERGVAIFLTSHDLDDIDEICDDTIVLSKGQLIYNGKLADLKHGYIKDKVITITGTRKADLHCFLPLVTMSENGRTTTLVYSKDAYTTEQVLTAVSKSFDIADITIQEPGIDDVVSRIFTEGLVQS